MAKKRRLSVLIVQVILLSLGLLALMAYFGLRAISPILMNLANFFMTIGFTFLGIMALLEITLAHEKVPEWRRNCLFVEPHSAAVTPQAIRLSEALTDRGISNKQEYYDGHKCVDIYIPGASLNLEIDGRHHLTDPDQLLSDLYRDYYSFRDGKVTIHIPNFYVDTDLDALANSIAVVARKRQG